MSSGWGGIAVVNESDRCANCGESFSEHNYVIGEQEGYRCPVLGHDVVYGFFHGGDPRTFTPDVEGSTKKEIDHHKKACQFWDELESRGETPDPEKCPSGWILNDDGERVCHVLRAPYGIGVQMVEFEQFFESAELDNGEDGDY